MKPVNSKKDFTERYLKGEFGNRSPTWNSYQELLQDPMEFKETDLFHVRSKIIGGPTHYNLHYVDIYSFLPPNSDYYISMMCPTEETVIQGEVMQSVNHLTLTYTMIPKPMRTALSISTKTAQGLMAFSMLKKYLCPNSIDWLYHLLDAYQGHVIEFTCFGNHQFGTIPHMNTVFWEVRNY